MAVSTYEIVHEGIVGRLPAVGADSCIEICVEIMIVYDRFDFANADVDMQRLVSEDGRSLIEDVVAKQLESVKGLRHYYWGSHRRGRGCN